MLFLNTQGLSGQLAAGCAVALVRLCATATAQYQFPCPFPNDGIDVGQGRGDGAQSSPTGIGVGVVEAGVLPVGTDLDHAITKYIYKSKMMQMPIMKLKYRYLRLMSK